MRTLSTLFLLLCSATHGESAGETPNQITSFILQPTRTEKTLRNDALFIADFVLRMKPGDEVNLITTGGGEEVFSYQASSTKTKRIEVSRAQKRAISRIRPFFLNLLDNPPPEDAASDFAGAIALAIERFSSTSSHRRMSLVIMGDGLQNDGIVDWKKGHYPNGAWIVHELSPFVGIPHITGKAKLDCLFMYERSDYVNAHHQRKIETWYRWLFAYKGVNLNGFTFDHKVASKILSRGSTKPFKPPKPQDLVGDIELTEVDRLVPTDKHQK